MPRRPRLVVPGIPHHVTQRGNNRQVVFSSDQDRRLYLDLLTHYAIRFQLRIVGYCLMTNHIHLIAIPEREDSLARALRQAHAEYALAFNRSSCRSGHLWQNRFFSCLLEGAHVTMALQYTDLNPVRAGLVTNPWDWPWSSARPHCSSVVEDPVLDPGWAETIGQWDFDGWRERLALGLAEADCALLRRATNTGEPLGSRAFLLSLERQAHRRLKVFARGRPPKKPDGLELCGVQEMYLSMEQGPHR